MPKPDLDLIACDKTAATNSQSESYIQSASMCPSQLGHVQPFGDVVGNWMLKPSSPSPVCNLYQQAIRRLATFQVTARQFGDVYDQQLSLLKLEPKVDDFFPRHLRMCRFDLKVSSAELPSAFWDLVSVLTMKEVGFDVTEDAQRTYIANRLLRIIDDESIKAVTSGLQSFLPTDAEEKFELRIRAPCLVGELLDIVAVASHESLVCYTTESRVPVIFNNMERTVLPVPMVKPSALDRLKDAVDQSTVEGTLPHVLRQYPNGRLVCDKALHTVRVMKQAITRVEELRCCFESLCMSVANDMYGDLSTDITRVDEHLVALSGSSAAMGLAARVCKGIAVDFLRSLFEYFCQFFMHVLDPLLIAHRAAGCDDAKADYKQSLEIASRVAPAYEAYQAILQQSANGKLNTFLTDQQECWDQGKFAHSFFTAIKDAREFVNKEGEKDPQASLTFPAKVQAIADMAGDIADLFPELKKSVASFLENEKFMQQGAARSMVCGAIADQVQTLFNSLKESLTADLINIELSVELPGEDLDKLENFHVDPKMVDQMVAFADSVNEPILKKEINFIIAWGASRACAAKFIRFLQSGECDPNAAEMMTEFHTSMCNFNDATGEMAGAFQSSESRLVGVFADVFLMPQTIDCLKEQFTNLLKEAYAAWCELLEVRAKAIESKIVPWTDKRGKLLTDMKLICALVKAEGYKTLGKDAADMYLLVSIIRKYFGALHNKTGLESLKWGQESAKMAVDTVVVTKCLYNLVVACGNKLSL